MKLHQLGLPVLAALTGQVVLIALVAAIAVAGVGVVLWRRRHGGCAASRTR